MMALFRSCKWKQPTIQQDVTLPKIKRGFSEKRQSLKAQRRPATRSTSRCYSLRSSSKWKLTMCVCMCTCMYSCIWMCVCVDHSENVQFTLITYMYNMWLCVCTINLCVCMHLCPFSVFCALYHAHVWMIPCVCISVCFGWILVYYICFSLCYINYVSIAIWIFMLFMVFFVSLCNNVFHTFVHTSV